MTSSASFQAFFRSLRVLSDLSFCALTILAAFIMRFGHFKGASPLVGEYFMLAVVFSIVTVNYMYLLDMYGERHSRSGVDELFGSLKAATMGFVIVIALTFFYRDYEFSRLAITYAIVLSYALLSGSRIGILAVERKLLRAGYGIKRLLIVGTGIHFDLLVDRILGHSEFGYRLVGYLEENPDETLRKIPLLGGVEEAPRIIESGIADEAIITLNRHAQKAVQTIIDACDRNHVTVKLAANLLELMVGPREIEEFFGIPLIHFKGMRIKWSNALFKRDLDIAFGSAILLAASPVILISAIIIKLTSPGPVFYTQKRIGLDDQEFDIYKLRSMHVDAEAGGPKWSQEKDDRVTPFGKIIRKLSIDELPQLINVIIGDMSLVGPRPERRVFIDEFQQGIPRYLERHRVKTGLTGWAQVNGLRGATSIEDRTQYDLYYIENWSIWFDLRILIMTIVEVLREAVR